MHVNCDVRAKGCSAGEPLRWTTERERLEYLVSRPTQMSSSVRAPSVCVSGCCSCSVVQALICWRRAPWSVRNVCAHARFVFAVFFSSRRFRNSHDLVDGTLRHDVHCNRRLPPLSLFCFVRVFLHSLRSACIGCRVRESACRKRRPPMVSCMQLSSKEWTVAILWTRHWQRTDFARLCSVPEPWLLSVVRHRRQQIKRPHL